MAKDGWEVNDIKLYPEDDGSYKLKISYPEIDEAVARKLGWVKPTREFEPWKRGEHEMRTPYEMPSYSTSIEATWEIVEKWGMEEWAIAFIDGQFVVHERYYTDKEMVLAKAPTAPLAICKAFLKLEG